MPDSFDLQLSPRRTRARSQWTRESASSLHMAEPGSKAGRVTQTFHGLFYDFLITFSITSKPHKTESLRLQLGGGEGCKCSRLHMLFHL